MSVLADFCTVSHIIWVYSRFLRFSIVGFSTFNANFRVGTNLWYHQLYFFKTNYQTFLQLKLPPLTYTFRICTLDFVIFPDHPEFCVANVFTQIGLNFHFYFPNVSWLKSMISRLSNALSTVSIALLDPEIL